MTLEQPTLSKDDSVQELPPFNEIVGYLAAQKPESLEALKASYPEYLHMLKPGMIAGHLKGPVKVALDGCVLALKDILPRSIAELDRCKQRSKATKHFRAASRILKAVQTFLTGTTVFTLFIEVKVAMVAAILGLIIQFIEIYRDEYMALDLNDPATLESFQKLVSARYSSEDLLREVDLWSTLKYRGATPEQINTLIGRGNALCYQMRECLELLAIK